MMRIKTTATLLVIAGFGAAALTGCSAGAQSVAEACETAKSIVSESQSDLTAVQTDVTSGDFSKVNETLGALEDKFGEAASKVTNSEVKAALEGMSTSVGNFASIFEGVDDGDISALAEKMGGMTDAVQDVQTSGQKLSTLCTE